MIPRPRPRDVALLIALTLITIMLLVGACSPSPVLPPNDQAYVEHGCHVMARSLKVLAAARSQGRLSREQIETVDGAINLAIPVCLAPEPPADGVATLDQVNDVLEGMIFGLQT